jgi:hypothetical protein
MDAVYDCSYFHRDYTQESLEIVGMEDNYPDYCQQGFSPKLLS